MRNDSGNILFIILIAVALFASLSYAVTQSSRGGANNTAKETATINSSVLSQYTSSIRASIQRMTTDNHTIQEIEFNAPADFADLTSPEIGVFHPSGGGVIYTMAPAALIDPQSDNPTGRWVFNMNFEVANVGTSVPGSLDGNDLIAFLVGVKKDVCTQVNERLGIPIQPFPMIDSQTFSYEMIIDPATYDLDNDYTFPASEYIMGDDTENAMLVGKAEGCYREDEADNYVYYSVLSER